MCAVLPRSRSRERSLILPRGPIRPPLDPPTRAFRPSTLTPAMPARYAAGGSSITRREPSALPSGLPSDQGRSSPVDPDPGTCRRDTLLAAAVSREGSLQRSLLDFPSTRGFLAPLHHRRIEPRPCPPQPWRRRMRCKPAIAGRETPAARPVTRAFPRGENRRAAPFPPSHCARALRPLRPRPRVDPAAMRWVAAAGILKRAIADLRCANPAQPRPVRDAPDGDQKITSARPKRNPPLTKPWVPWRKHRSSDDSHRQ
jgi:hypothetical protein